MPAPTVPGYELLHCLGGGMLTTVYAARSYESEGLCAVKLPRPEWSDQPIAVKLLQREARAAFAVAHPSLVKVIDAHVLKPPHFLAMEMLSGESLRRRLRRDYRLDTTSAVWFARQIAEALSALHRKGFIHGDVKPDNVRLLADGRAVLLDLGFAHRAGENASLFEAGYILGTVDYLAPELCGPEPHDDPRSDIFSLGAMLFEMLTGELPYESGGVVDTLRRRQTDPARFLSEWLENVPRGLATPVNCMLSRHPQDRPNAVAVVQELIACEIATLRGRRAA